MTRKQYDLEFKKMVIQKGNEIGNMSAVARQHELDPKMVLRWAKQLNRKDLEQLKADSKRVAAKISEWIMELLAGEEHAYGYRKLTLMLRRQLLEWLINFVV